nr:glycosyltransferase [Variovorax boronicumulans]
MHKTPQLQRARQHWEAGRRADKDRRWDGALREYERATQLAPRESLYWMSLATARLQHNQIAEAEHAAGQAHALQPEALSARVLAHVLGLQNRHGEAALVYLGLPASVARNEELLMQQAECLMRACRWQDAIVSYLACLRHNPHNPVAYLNMGMAFKSLQRPRDAAVCLETAVGTDKTGQVRMQALSMLVHMLQMAMQWDDLGRHLPALMQLIDAAPDALLARIEPFTLVALPTTPAQQRRVYQAIAQGLQARLQPLPPRAARRPGPLRIGYLSADFYSHATAHLLSELLELHDRSRFEVFLYCHSPRDGTAVQQRIRAAADHFCEIHTLSDAAAAQRMREDDLDIAIDLKGYTKDTRLQILVHRPAPVQVGYLGFPGTSGGSFLDYLIGDPVVTPLEHAAHFSERIAQMPHSYQPNDSRRMLPARPARAELGLPDDAVVLCSFNQSYKVTPAMADAWTRILQAAPHAVLWQVNWADQASANFVREMVQRGVAAERLFFSPTASPAEHLARLQCADLMLDTWPCNAHTTASDALWCGVPVLTLPGQSFAGRVAASLVSACGLSELVCTDADAYVERAVALAGDPAALAALRERLHTQRDHLPLFDSRRYVRDYEALLQRMWERHAQGLPPEHLPAAPAA